MEFEHVGAHCEMEHCNQQDFLPFHCEYCGKQLCLEHRSLAAHNCPKQSALDMTSIDCPICSKTIKFAKSVDVNTAWETHFRTACDSSGTTGSKEKKYCARSGCRNILGPSNTFICPKCHKVLCISHRNASEHECIVVHVHSQAKARYDAAKVPGAEAGSGAGAAKAKAKTTMSKGKQGKVRDELRETAHRRRKEADNTHTNTNTNTYTNTTTNTHTTDTEVISSNEACPICGASFVDAIMLVAHVESAHNSDDNNTNTNINTNTHTNDTNRKDVSNCLVS